MTSTLLTRGALIAATSALALTLSACGSDDTSTGTATGSSSAGAGSAGASSAGTGAAESSAAEGSGGMASAEEPFGEGCAQVPAQGRGSFQGMSTDPVATAASNNPVLSTLVKAVTAANLVDTLNSQEDVTVLAPANPAFEAVPANALNGLLADVPQLTTVLTHHVIDGRLTPDELAGEHTTLNNDKVTIEGSGEDFSVAADQTVTGTEATVICGNVQTANATVYIIDQVLKPAA